ncbi:MAG: SUMF1/EgtB/PvdO family nonheme iron enzyme, partial [Elusimicrobiota bacterium]
MNSKKLKNHLTEKVLNHEVTKVRKHENFVSWCFSCFRGNVFEENVKRPHFHFSLLLTFAIIIASVSVAISPLYSNNVQIGSLSFSATSTSMDISFTVSQENTISTFSALGTPEEVKDCVWVFVKYSTNGVGGPWLHCKVSTVSAGGATSATLLNTSDKLGAFLFANKNSSYWSSENVKLRWTVADNGLSVVPSSVTFRVMGIEFAYISTGSFVYNVANLGGTTFNNYPGSAGPVTVSSIEHYPVGASNTWPNGFRAFYVGKYELSQRQYADFLNTVDPAGSSGATYYDSTLYNTWEYYIQRDVSRPVGDRYYVQLGRDTLGCNYLSWADMTAYISWAGLRPMTEMEYERAARGRGDSRIYPWGDTDPTGDTVETKSGTSYDCYLNYANWYDTANNLQNQDGPTPVGHYLSGLNISGGAVSRTNAQTGASQYGISDLSGCNWEHMINCNSTTTPLNGDGTLTPPASWPGALVDKKGLRGGDWARR